MGSLNQHQLDAVLLGAAAALLVGFVLGVAWTWRVVLDRARAARVAASAYEAQLRHRAHDYSAEWQRAGGVPSNASERCFARIRRKMARADSELSAAEAVEDWAEDARRWWVPRPRRREGLLDTQRAETLRWAEGELAALRTIGKHRRELTREELELLTFEAAEGFRKRLIAGVWQSTGKEEDSHG